VVVAVGILPITTLLQAVEDGTPARTMLHKLLTMIPTVTRTRTTVSIPSTLAATRASATIVARLGEFQSLHLCLNLAIDTPTVTTRPIAPTHASSVLSLALAESASKKVTVRLTALRSLSRSARLAAMKVRVKMNSFCETRDLTPTGHIASECTGARLLYDDTVPIIGSNEAWKEVKKHDATNEVDLLRKASCLNSSPTRDAGLTSSRL